MLRNLIIGNGEVGNSLYKYLISKKQQVEIRDIKEIQTQNEYDMLHICYGYSDKFIQQTKDYIKRYKPKYVIVHSTTIVGTCKKLKVIHSPIRGIHPHLEKSIKTFTKFFGGNVDSTLKKWIESTFNKTVIVPNSNTTEALKIWSTTQYGVMILLEKEIHKYCKKHKLPFNVVYTLANETYNEGYKKLGFNHFNRPILKHMKGNLGRHCITNNCGLLDNYFTDLIIQKNKKL